VHFKEKYRYPANIITAIAIIPSIFGASTGPGAAW
jgi:hypothetical protein